MGLRSNVLPLEEQLVAIDGLLKKYGPRARRNPDDANVCAVLKAVHANIKARLECPRSLPLGELERALKQALRSKTGIGYEQRDLAAIAHAVIQRWPHIREALEFYGERTAE